MQIVDSSHAYRDVGLYPPDQLKQHDQAIEVFATYKKVWNDGFGARGWKLNATIGDAEIIASTRQTGQRINTSVFVHDVLDHFLSGFGVSGHRSEAMALVQLAKRTGSDPRPDFRQMVNEDILNGRVSGESLLTFLPDRMLSLLPAVSGLTNKAIISTLRDAMGEDVLVEALVDHFFVVGRKGESHAVESWVKLGLMPENATRTGLALQAQLEKVDYEAENSNIDRLDASIMLSNDECVFIAKPLMA